MELLKMYLEERMDNKSLIYYEDSGFATYILTDEYVYIEDIFVIKAQRKSNLATIIADEIAEIGINNGCTYMLGSVVPSTKGADMSIKVLQAYGMTLESSDNNMIWFRKELKVKDLDSKGAQ